MDLLANNAENVAQYIILNNKNNNVKLQMRFKDYCC